MSSILLTLIDAAQTPLKNVSSAYNVHYTELIKAIIIYFASFSSFFGMLLRHLYERKENRIHHHDINSDDNDDDEKMINSSDTPLLSQPVNVENIYSSDSTLKSEDSTK